MVPAPRTTEVCWVCNLDWDSHEREATKRARRDWYSQFDVHDAQPAFPDDSEVTVDLMDCITLLQKRFEGPMGPTGPMGAQGGSAQR